jgi:hypothetical protein
MMKQRRLVKMYNKCQFLEGHKMLSRITFRDLEYTTQIATMANTHHQFTKWDHQAEVI